MQFREAQVTDIPQMMEIRNSVKENQLSDPALISFDDYSTFISNRGKGWISLEDELVTGFAVVDLVEHNVWALFVRPGYEGNGIGTILQQLLLTWYFQQTSHPVWLSTSPGTRAETFYRKSGWHETGVYGKGEIRFERNKPDSNAPLSGL
ncbi:MAG: GNAT family N-acetyltransferase [Bacteroidetes bacterium]|nr:GNAT family N-acetyltransferase [Bacteroidota bacterium]MBK7389517.1 GNAT family N-acetyltransferase [Bacteroidota bacterium]MBK7968625.1 GNAT family N-acetyltransferase [Bacteroidota bacterium]MBK8875858.1 GNAT family N-acetyltransferase [Bacteroidota bacterium]MBK9423864.1 GNAT family N-acetyltransferase [Bacteroidota bacterium]